MLLLLLIECMFNLQTLLITQQRKCHIATLKSQVSTIGSRSELIVVPKHFSCSLEGKIVELICILKRALLVVYIHFELFAINEEDLEHFGCAC